MRRCSLLLAAGLVLVGCSGGPDPTTTPTSAPTDTGVPTTDAPTTSAPTPDTSDSGTSSPAAPSSSPPGTSAPFPANTRPDTHEGSGNPVTVTDVRVGRHDGYERVVLDVGGGGQPGWDARYVDDPRHQGSGDPVDVDGDAVLVVDVTNVGHPEDTGVAMYDGPSRLAVGDTILEVVVGSTFEGHTQVFLGVAGQQRFRVQWIDGSVVVDVVSA